MKYAHAETGKVLEPAPGSFLAELVDGDPLWLVHDDGFDPSKHTVAEVVAHLSDADDAERARALAAEAEGKARKGVVEWAPELDA